MCEASLKTLFILGVPLDPGIQKAKRKAFIERAFAYGCWNGVWWRFKSSNIALVLVFVMGALYLEVCRRPKGFLARERERDRERESEIGINLT